MLNKYERKDTLWPCQTPLLTRKCRKFICAMPDKQINEMKMKPFWQCSPYFDLNELLPVQFGQQVNQVQMICHVHHSHLELIIGDRVECLLEVYKVHDMMTEREREREWLLVLACRLVAWLSGRTSVFSRRTFPVLRSTCSWRVTTYVIKPSAIGEHQSIRLWNKRGEPKHILLDYIIIIGVETSQALNIECHVDTAKSHTTSGWELTR